MGVRVAVVVGDGVAVSVAVGVGVWLITGVSLGYAQGKPGGEMAEDDERSGL